MLTCIDHEYSLFIDPTAVESIRPREARRMLTGKDGASGWSEIFTLEVHMKSGDEIRVFFASLSQAKEIQAEIVRLASRG